MRGPRPTWGRAAIAFLLFGGVGLVFFFGAAALGVGGGEAARRWLALAHGQWALPAAVAAFAALAFLGVPQFVLIAAAVAAFGPGRGFAYSWVGTMVSALVGFGLGRVAGERLIDAPSGGVIDRYTRLVARNGLIASLVVRLAPFAPFVLVNVAAGVARITVWDFIVGTALGIVPKIALTAFAGASIVRSINGGGGLPIILLALAAALWFGAGLAARHWMKR